MKTNYIAEPPPEYEFMRRYPPLHRDTAAKKSSLSPHRIPYIHLYRKAAGKNLLHADERVYPAYWIHEPSALTLAKKQYELMVDEGLCEDDAYRIALTYVDDIENASYEELKEFRAKLEKNNSLEAFVSAPELVQRINYFKLLVNQSTSYDDLDLAIQGEIDHFIQTKILKWNEVERERRMRDPMFAINFEKVRTIILEDFEQSDDECMIENTVEKLPMLTQMANFSTKERFCYQDYAFHFENIKQCILNETCSDLDIKEMDAWCRNTLVMNIFGRKLEDSKEYEDHVEDIKLNFFPFLKCRRTTLTNETLNLENNVNYQGTENISDFKIPGVATFRCILFRNGIGYQSDEEGKLYVRRFYRIPALLWPFHQKYGNVGLRKKSKEFFPLLSSRNRHVEWKESLRNITLSKNSDNASKETTSLHEEIQKLDISKTDRVDEICDSSTLLGLLNGINANSVRNRDFRSDQKVRKCDVDEGLKERSSENSSSLERWNELQVFTEKKLEMPRTLLQIERENWFRQAEYFSSEDASDENEFLSISGSRVDHQLMTRAELSMKYEEKEASRRNSEWSSRLLPWEKEAYEKHGEGNIEGNPGQDYFDIKLSLPMLD